MVLFGLVCPVPLSPVRLNTNLPTSVLRHDKTTRVLVDSFHRAELLLSCSSTRQTLSATSSAHSPLNVDGVISNFPERIASQ